MQASIAAMMADPPATKPRMGATAATTGTSTTCAASAWRTRRSTKSAAGLEVSLYFSHCAAKRESPRGLLAFASLAAVCAAQKLSLLRLFALSPLGLGRARSCQRLQNAQARNAREKEKFTARQAGQLHGINVRDVVLMNGEERVATLSKMLCCQTGLQNYELLPSAQDASAGAANVKP